MGVHYGLFGSSVALLGDEQQCRRWLQDIEDARMLGCFALTEIFRFGTPRMHGLVVL